MSGKFSPKDKKPAFKVIQDEKPVEKINLNFKKKKKEEPAYTLKPNQRAFKVPETKKPEEKESLKPILSTLDVGGNWFESLFGFSEKPDDYEHNKNNFILN